MLDPWTIKLVQSPLNFFARKLKKKGVKPDHITMAGFIIGLFSFFALWMCLYKTALSLILLNRFMDGLDGSLARQTKKTDAGGFLDICLDFLFYSLVPAGFALADPNNNAIAALFLIFSFVGTGTSFLAFAVMAQKYKLNNISYPHKAMYYMGGLTEGTETILFFTLFCIFPQNFASLAYLFAGLCLITAITRIWSGYSNLKNIEKKG